jgi:hypothetical protein
VVLKWATAALAASPASFHPSKAAMTAGEFSADELNAGEFNAGMPSNSI